MTAALKRLDLDDYLVGLSPATRQTYAKSWRAFEAWRAAAGCGDPLPDFFRDPEGAPPGTHARSLAAAWREAMHLDGMSNATINLRLAVLRFVATAGGIHYVLPRAPSMTRRPEARLCPIKRDQFDRMLAVAEGEWPAVLRLMGLRGLRGEEVCRLRRSDWDAAGGLLRVHGKGGRRDDLEIGQGTREALEVWLASTAGAADDPVFPGMTTARMRRRVPEIAREAGIRARVQVHDLRRLCAELVLAATGGNALTTQDALRHAHPSTTARYIAARERRHADVMRAIG